jgi:hypothetical protein
MERIYDGRMVDMERLFVPSRMDRRAEIAAYLYHGWEIDTAYGTGVGPFAGMGGFYLSRTLDTGSGFGIGPLRDRLASGLFASLDVSNGGA